MTLASIIAVADPSITEAGLVAQARQGDELAIRKLIRANNQRLFRVARGVVRDDAEAEDVVQAAYVAAFTKLDGFREDARFSTWLTRIALNEAMGRVRRRRPTAELDSLDQDGAADSGWTEQLPISLMPLAADSEISRSEMRHLIEDAIDSLPEAFRLVFILRDVEGLSQLETAAQLGLKVETVKTRLHRARQALRASIEEKVQGSFAEVFPFDGQRCNTMADRIVVALVKLGRVVPVDRKEPNG